MPKKFSQNKIGSIEKSPKAANELPSPTVYELAIGKSRVQDSKKRRDYSTQEISDH